MWISLSRLLLLLAGFYGTIRAADFGPKAREWQQQNQRALDEAGKLSLHGEAARGNQVLLDLAQKDNSGISAFIVGNMLYSSVPEVSYRLHARALEVFPAEPACQLEMAMEQHRKREYGAAIANYVKALSAGIDSHFSCLLADCYIRDGLFVEAVKAWDRAGHGRSHTEIDFAIYAIYGDLMPNQRRSDLIAAVKSGATTKLAELIKLDLHFDRDWWNSSVNDKALDEDLKLADRILGKDTAFARQLSVYARIARNEQMTPEEIKALFGSAGMVVGGDATLPESSYLTRAVCELAIRRRVVSAEDLWRWHELGLRQRIANKDRDALHLLCLLAAQSNDSRLPELDRIGWKEWHDPQFAVSYIVGLLKTKTLTEPNDPELLAAEAVLPDDNTLVGIKLMLAGEDRITRDLVVAAIKAEYHKLSDGLMIPDSYKLKGLFQVLSTQLGGADQNVKSLPQRPASNTVAPKTEAAQQLRLNETDALTILIPKSWHAEATKPQHAGFAFLTFVFRPNGDRNAECLISVYSKDDPRAQDMAFIRKLLTADSAPWIETVVNKEMSPISVLLFAHGKGAYASFVDEKRVGMPVKKGDYKIATTFILTIDKQYLTKVTVLCDDLASPDYKEALAMVKTLAAERL
jgi:hypothetical protein